MNRERFSAIAHGELTYWNPVGAARIDAQLAALELPENAQVLDIGCGRGALLCRLAERQPQARCLGLDPSPFAYQAAQQAAYDMGVTQRVSFEQQPYQAERFAPQSQDLVVIFGASHALSLETPLQAALAEAHRLLRPGGQLLLAEGTWQRQPSQAYLDFLQAQESDANSHQGNIQQCEAAGFTVLNHFETTQAEWDDYENSYAGNMLRYLDENPADPDAAAMRERITTWHDGYLRLGRGVMGFAVYLLQKQ